MLLYLNCCTVLYHEVFSRGKAMTSNTLKFDTIGVWSQLKLEIVRQYAQAYSTILAKQPRLTHVYIDAFAGAGLHRLKRTN